MEGCPRDQGRLVGAVDRREIEIVAAGHHGGGGLDAAQGYGEGRVGRRRHIIGKPHIEHGDQVAGVMAAVGGQPGVLHVVLHGVVAELPVGAAAVVGLAGSPAGVDQREGAQPLFWNGVEAAAVPGRIGAEGLAQAEQKQTVVGGGAGRAADAADPPGPLRFEHRPVVGLLGPHRPAIDQSRPLHAEHLLQQPDLGPQVVAVIDRPAARAQRRTAIAGAAGAAIAELAHQHHAVLAGIEDRPHRPGDVLRPGAVGAGIEHQVGALAIQLAEHAVIELGGAHGFAAGQGKGAELKAACVGEVHGLDPFEDVRCAPERRCPPMGLA